MHEILEGLSRSALVLDLGCARGSFDASGTRATVVRLDRIVESVPGEHIVQGDAARLPFSARSMAAIVANHSLEHFDDLGGCLREIGRVIRRDGALFVSVPDASTLTDKLYRSLAGGGGHVNPFVAPEQVIRIIEAETGLPHVATRVLCSSLSFLNRRNSPQPRPRRLLLLGGGHEWSLLWYTWMSRRIDRILHLRTSVYGWAFYFGSIAADIDTATSANVCIRCGSGVPAAALYSGEYLRRSWCGVRMYSCPGCGARNTFHPD